MSEPLMVQGVLMVREAPPTSAPAVPVKVTPVPACTEEVATLCTAPVSAPYKRRPMARVVLPVPPPETVRVPETVGVNVSVPADALIVWPKVRPLKANVLVAKVMAAAVVVEYPEPSAVNEPEPVPTQIPFTAKHPPPFKSMPPVELKVEVPVEKLMPFAVPIERSEPGVEVLMPTKPALLTMNFVAVDEPITNDGAVPSEAEGLIESCAHGEVVPRPTLPVRYAVVVFGSNQYSAVVVEFEPTATMSSASMG